jgi:hypothetical protein
MQAQLTKETTSFSARKIKKKNANSDAAPKHPNVPINPITVLFPSSRPLQNQEAAPGAGVGAVGRLSICRIKKLFSSMN